jgi:hypothetical protein
VRHLVPPNGPVAQDASGDFDRYWASDSSYPVHRPLPLADPHHTARSVGHSFERFGFTALRHDAVWLPDELCSPIQLT